MADLDRLRDLSEQVRAPAFDSLVDTARRRDRLGAGAVAAALVLVVTLVGAGTMLAARTDGSLEPVERPTPSPSPTSTVPTYAPGPREVYAVPPDTVEYARMEEGRYEIRLDDDLAYSIDVPDGWVTWDGSYLAPEGSGPLLQGFPLGVVAVPVHPCRDHTPVLVGSPVADLVSAVQALPGVEVSAHSTTVGGYAATRLEVTTPDGFDVTACEDGELEFVLSGQDGLTWDGPYAGRWWVVEHTGGVIVLAAHCAPDACLDADEVDAIVATVAFRAEG